MKKWVIAKNSAVKSLIAVICILSLVATGITGCGSSQPNESNTVSNATGGTKTTWEMKSSRFRPMYRGKRLTSFLILMLKKKSRYRK